MSNLSRRQWLQRTAAVAGGFAIPTLIPAGVLAAGGRPGANDRITVGAIGVGGRASLLLEQLPEGAKLVALCDCNLPRAEGFKAKKKANWPVYQDYHRLLERKDLDAVIVATGEFQRVLPCIHACQAGKDVYAEKPLTLYIREGRVLVNAVRKYGRVLQVGSQQRSMAMNRIACELIRTGGLGRVLEVRAMNYPSSEPSPAGGLPQQPVPKGLNWDVWLNQAAMRPFNQAWMKWMDWRDFAGGEITNWGAHGVDQIQWALGMDGTGPVEMEPEGTEGQVAIRYANGVPVRFMLPWGHGPIGGAVFLCEKERLEFNQLCCGRRRRCWPVFVCEKGKLEINRNKFTSNPKSIAKKLLQKVNEAEEEKKWSDQTALWQAKWHMQNWLDCIRTRKRPVADVEIGHRSISVCHLVNITRQIGRRLQWDPAKEQFVGDEAANRLVDRVRRPRYELPELG